jgi:hypothetical protein
VAAKLHDQLQRGNVQLLVKESYRVLSILFFRLVYLLLRRLLLVCAILCLRRCIYFNKYVKIGKIGFNRWVREG